MLIKILEGEKTTTFKTNNMDAVKPILPLSLSPPLKKSAIVDAYILRLKKKLPKASIYFQNLTVKIC